MMTRSKLIVVMTAVTMLSLFAEAAQADRVNRRQGRQRARIAEGVQSGELTRQEAKGLRKRERHVRRLERRAKSDGNLTPAEKARIEGAQDRTSESIYEQKHDEQKRGNENP